METTDKTKTDTCKTRRVTDSPADQLTAEFIHVGGSKIYQIAVTGATLGGRLLFGGSLETKCMLATNTALDGLLKTVAITGVRLGHTEEQIASTIDALAETAKLNLPGIYASAKAQVEALDQQNPAVDNQVSN